MMNFKHYDETVIIRSFSKTDFLKEKQFIKKKLKNINSKKYHSQNEIK